MVFLFIVKPIALFGVLNEEKLTGAFNWRVTKLLPVKRNSKGLLNMVFLFINSVYKSISVFAHFKREKNGEEGFENVIQSEVICEREINLYTANKRVVKRIDDTWSLDLSDLADLINDGLKNSIGYRFRHDW